MHGLCTLEATEYAHSDIAMQVIPEIDMPGHSRAAVVAMEARSDSAYRLMDPKDTTKLLTVQFYDKRCVHHSCGGLAYGNSNRVALTANLCGCMGTLFTNI